MILIGVSLLIACALLDRWCEAGNHWMRLPETFFLLLIVMFGAGVLLIVVGLLRLLASLW